MLIPASSLTEPSARDRDNACKVAVSVLKRLLDFFGAASALAFLAPLLLLVAGAVVLDSKGPVLFQQRRTGLNGKPFKIYKFRSMRVMEDGHQVLQASQNDKRVTRVGAFLRRSSIDELPQLFNVLCGDMSLVGPRPHALAHDLQFSQVAPDYAGRFRARPGLTGLAQVHGFRGEIRAPSDILTRVEMDNAYVARWSILLDIQILARTAAVLPFQRRAY